MKNHDIYEDTRDALMLLSDEEDHATVASQILLSIIDRVEDLQDAREIINAIRAEMDARIRVARRGMAAEYAFEDHRQSRIKNVLEGHMEGVYDHD